MYMCIYVDTSTIYIISYIRDSIFAKCVTSDAAGWVFVRFSLPKEPFPVKTRGFVLWRPIYSQGP